MNNDPLVSVLIPTYNRAALIGEAIESVLAQTFSDYEIIVVDDGSSDSTSDVVGRYPDVRYYRQKHAGVSEARNTAIRLARGEWLAFLDSDDLWHPDKLSRQMNYLSAHPECRVVYTKTQNFCLTPPDRQTEKQKQMLCANARCVLPTALIHKSVFSEVGLFDASLPFGEDTEWNLRAAVHGVDLSHELPEPLYRRRIHGDNLTVTHEDEGGGDGTLKLAASVIRNYRYKGLKT